MEAREIIVANTKTQKRYKFESTATTLGELKADMVAHEIDYSGMSFTEGISKTQLLDDSSMLPTNLLYKGQTTNNLVILLTNTEKKIASGAMDRAEAFRLIKEYDLQDAVKENFDGRNFTQVSTADLEQFINDALKEDEPEQDEDKEDDDNYEDEESDENAPQEEETDYCPLLCSMYSVVRSLIKMDLISHPQLLDFIDNLESLAEETRKPDPVSMVIGTTTIDGNDVDDMINSIH